MIKISRDWATPLTMGVFGLMAITGLMMFFHVNSHLQESVHQWAGWLVVAAAVAHASANWPGFKRHLQPRGKGLVIVVLSAAVLAGSFLLQPAADAGQPPPAIAMRALAQAPVQAVAPLFGQTAEQARQALDAAGIHLSGDDASIASATGGDREKLGQALAALSRGSAR